MKYITVTLTRDQINLIADLVNAEKHSKLDWMEAQDRFEYREELTFIEETLREELKGENK